MSDCSWIAFCQFSQCSRFWLWHHWSPPTHTHAHLRHRRVRREDRKKTKTRKRRRENKESGVKMKKLEKERVKKEEREQERLTGGFLFSQLHNWPVQRRMKKGSICFQFCGRYERSDKLLWVSQKLKTGSFHIQRTGCFLWPRPHKKSW